MVDVNKINETIEIDRTNTGKLSVSATVIQKLIYQLLTSENYQLTFNHIKVTSKENDDLETQIQVIVHKKSNLNKLKEQIINLILKRISAVLNVNITNINLIFATN